MFQDFLGNLTWALCHSASRCCISSFETVNTLRTALSSRLASVLPGTGGAGNPSAGSGYSSSFHVHDRSSLVSTNLWNPTARICLKLDCHSPLFEILYA